MTDDTPCRYMVGDGWQVKSDGEWVSLGGRPELTVGGIDTASVEGYTPNEELRELVEEWRGMGGDEAYEAATSEHADDLEAVIEGHE